MGQAYTSEDLRRAAEENRRRLFNDVLKIIEEGYQPDERENRLGSVARAAAGGVKALPHSVVQMTGRAAQGAIGAAYNPQYAFAALARSVGIPGAPPPGINLGPIRKPSGIQATLYNVAGIAADGAGKNLEEIQRSAVGEERGPFSPETLAFETTRTAGLMIPAIASALLGGPIGLAGSLGYSFALEYASQVEQNYHAYKAAHPQSSDEEALAAAFGGAAPYASISSLIEIFGGKGAELLASNTPLLRQFASKVRAKLSDKDVQKTLVKKTLENARTLAQTAVTEGVQETAQQAVSLWNQSAVSGQAPELSDAATEIGQAAVVGALAGGVTSGSILGARAVQERLARQGVGPAAVQRSEAPRPQKDSAKVAEADLKETIKKLDQALGLEKAEAEKPVKDDGSRELAEAEEASKELLSRETEEDRINRARSAARIGYELSRGADQDTRTRHRNVMLENAGLDPSKKEYVEAYEAEFERVLREREDEQKEKARRAEAEGIDTKIRKAASIGVQLGRNRSEKARNHYRAVLLEQFGLDPNSSEIINKYEREYGRILEAVEKRTSPLKEDEDRVLRDIGMGREEFESKVRAEADKSKDSAALQMASLKARLAPEFMEQDRLSSELKARETEDDRTKRAEAAARVAFEFGRDKSRQERDRIRSVFLENAGVDPSNPSHVEAYEREFERLVASESASRDESGVEKLAVEAARQGWALLKNEKPELRDRMRGILLENKGLDPSNEKHVALYEKEYGRLRDREGELARYRSLESDKRKAEDMVLSDLGITREEFERKVEEYRAKQQQASPADVAGKRPTPVSKPAETEAKPPKTRPEEKPSQREKEQAPQPKPKPQPESQPPQTAPAPKPEPQPPSKPVVLPEKAPTNLADQEGLSPIRPEPSVTTKPKTGPETQTGVAEPETAVPRPLEETPKPEPASGELSLLSNLDPEKRKRLEEIKKRLKEKLEREMYSGFDPEILALGTEAAAIYIEAGYKSFVKFAKAVVADIGDMIKPYLRAIYVGARNMPGVDTTGMDPTSYVESLTDKDIDRLLSDTGVEKDEVQKPQPRPEVEEKPEKPGVKTPTGENRPETKPRPNKPTTAPENRPQPAPSGTTITVSPPGRSASALNHVIDYDDSDMPTTDAARFDANVLAIQTLKTIESEGRNATKEEKRALAMYSGWGWAGSLFDDRNTRHREKREIIRRLLTDEEYRSAAASTVNAHYTSLFVVRSMWNIAAHLGFKGGRVLEPGAGIGNFFGAMPEQIAANSSLVGIELDSVSGRIMRVLYPGATVYIDGYEKVRIPNNSFDLVIGNVPFSGTIRPYGNDYDDLLLHDYFIARSLDKVRPGGLVIVITSDGTMDKHDMSARLLFAKKAELIGAIRLPNTTFEKNAGTSVTSDILIFRKKDHNLGLGKKFIEVVKVGTWPTQKLVEKFMRRLENAKNRLNSGEISIREYERIKKSVEEGIERYRDASEVVIYANEYFRDNPRMALGVHSLEGTMYAPGDYALLPRNDRPFRELMFEATGYLPANIYDQGSGIVDVPDAPMPGEIPGSTVRRPGNGDGFFVVEGEQLIPAPWLTHKIVGSDPEAPISIAEKEERMAIAGDWIDLREAVQKLIRLERSESASEEDIERARRVLNEKYDAFVERHGQLNHPTQAYRNPASFLESDPEYYLVQSLEDETHEPLDAPGRKPTARERRLGYKISYKKHALFFKRQYQPLKEPTKADSMQDAVANSLGYRGRVDPEYVGRLLGIDSESAKKKIIDEGFAFEDPETGELVPRAKYLSGNVRQKLLIAEKAAASQPDVYSKNVEALRGVQPNSVPIHHVRYRFGSRWIPDWLKSAFVRQHMGGEVVIKYLSEANIHEITIAKKSAVMEEEYTVRDHRNGKEVFSVYDVLKHALEGTIPPMIKVRESEAFGDRESTIQLVEETFMARELVDRVSNEFISWSQNPDSRVDHDGKSHSVPDLLERIYNDTVNVMNPMKASAEWLRPVGLSPSIKLYDYQRDVIGRIILERSVVMAHAAGAGKTIAMSVAAMEMKRLGLARKPMIVVQKSTLYQFAREFRRAYPHAKVLVATDRSFTPKRRKRFIAQAAMTDWDAIIVTLPQFERMAISNGAATEYIESMIREMYLSLYKVKDKMTKKRIEEKIAALRNLLVKINNAINERSDHTVVFDDLGVDFLFLDEAHNFKSGMIVTTKRNVKGIPDVYSWRAINAAIKAEYIRRLRGDNGGVVAATGTPIMNSITEAYTITKLAVPHILSGAGIRNFDEFVDTFGSMKTDIEYTWRQNFQPVTRLSSIVNIPELITYIRAGWDVVMDLADIGVNLPKLESKLVQVPQNRYYEEVSEIMLAAADVYDSLKGLEKRRGSHIPIVIIQMGLYAAVDPRLVIPNAPDEPNYKINIAANDIYRVWKDEAHRRGTMLVFLDRFSRFEAKSIRDFLDGKMHNSPEEEEVIDVNMYQQAKDKSTDEPETTEDEEKKNEASEISEYQSASFNIYKALKNKLVRLGIPENEVAIIHEYDTDDKRRVLFDQMNAGTVRVLIGSTERLGVGVNVQNRIVAMFHLDMPRNMNPAYLEQRRARAVRQGILFMREKLGDKPNPEYDPNFKVKEYVYAMPQSQETAIFQLIEYKWRLITRMLLGQAVGREMEDISDTAALADMARQRAILTGDDRAIKIVEKERELKTLLDRRAVHESGKATRRRRISDNKRIVEIATENIRILEDSISLLNEIISEPELSLPNGSIYRGHDSVVLAMNRNLYDHLRELSEKDKSVLNPSVKFKLNQLDATLSYSLENVLGTSDKETRRFHLILEKTGVRDIGVVAAPNAGTALNGIRNLVESHRNSLTHNRERLELAKKGIEHLESIKDVPFPDEDKIEKLRKEIEQIRESLIANKIGVGEESSHGFTVGTPLLDRNGNVGYIETVKESRLHPGTYHTLLVNMDGRVINMRDSHDVVEAWMNNARDALGGKTSVTSSVLNKLKALAKRLEDVANEMEEKRDSGEGIPRGRSTGGTTLISDLIYTVGAAASRALAGAIRAGVNITEQVILPRIREAIRSLRFDSYRRLKKAGIGDDVIENHALWFVRASGNDMKRLTQMRRVASRLARGAAVVNAAKKDRGIIDAASELVRRSKAEASKVQSVEGDGMEAFDAKRDSADIAYTIAAMGARALDNLYKSGASNTETSLRPLLRSEVERIRPYLKRRFEDLPISENSLIDAAMRMIEDSGYSPGIFSMAAAEMVSRLSGSSDTGAAGKHKGSSAIALATIRRASILYREVMRRAEIDGAKRLSELRRQWRDQARRMKMMVEIERRGERNAAAVQREVADGLRRQLAMKMVGLPSSVRGRHLRTFANVRTPLQYIRTLRAVERSAWKHLALNAARWIERNTTRKKIGRVRGMTQELRDRILSWREEARQLYAISRNRRANLDDLRHAALALHALRDSISEERKSASMQYRLMDKARKKKLAEAAANAVAGIMSHSRGRERPTGGMSYPEDVSMLRHVGRLGLDMRNTLSGLEGHGGELQKWLVERMKNAEERMLSLLRDKRDELNTLAVNAGFRSLTDMQNRISGYGGRGVTMTVEAKLGGMMVRIPIGHAISLIALASDPYVAERIAPDGEQEFRPDHGRNVRGFVPTKEEISSLKSMIDPDGKYQEFIDGAKRILESMVPDAQRAMYVLTGSEFVVAKDRWPIHRIIEGMRNDDELPERLINVIERYVQNDPMFITRVGSGAPIMLVDPVSDMIQQIERMAVLTHLAVPTHDAASILLSGPVRHAIVRVAGSRLYDSMRRHLMMMGRASRGRLTTIGRIGDWMNRSFINAKLGLNPVTWAIQFIGYLRHLPFMGSVLWLDGLKNWHTVSIRELRNASGYCDERWTEHPATRYSAISTRTSNYMPGTTMIEDLSRMRKNLTRRDFIAALEDARDAASRTLHVLNLCDAFPAQATYAALDRHSRRVHPEWTDEQRQKWVISRTIRIFREAQGSQSPIDAPLLWSEVLGTGFSMLTPLTTDAFRARNRIISAFRRSRSFGISVLATELMNISLVTTARVSIIGAVMAAAAALIDGLDEEDRELIAERYFSAESAAWSFAREALGTAMPIMGHEMVEQIRSLVKGGYSPNVESPTLIGATVSGLWKSVGSLYRETKKMLEDESTLNRVLAALGDVFNEMSQAAGVNPLGPHVGRLLRQYRVESSRELATSPQW